MHLLQVYSNPSAEIVTPRELLFRSSPRESADDAPQLRRRARQLHANDIEALVARYLEVRNMRTVARELKISRTTVARILAEHGINRSRSMSGAQISIAVELYQQGQSSVAIGKRLGFENHTILKELRRRGVAIRPAIGRQPFAAVERGEATQSFSDPAPPRP